MKKILFLILILASNSNWYELFQADYFVSATGNDSNSGIYPWAAWKTLAKVNSTTFVRGDRIGFHCGDYWEGIDTIKTNGLTYKSYGSGDMPKIYGSVPLTGWTLKTGWTNLYKIKANKGATITQLFMDGKRMTEARYPNSGMDFIETVNTTKSFTSNELNASINYAGASWIGRTSLYSMPQLTVTSSSSKTITLPSVPYGGLHATTNGFILVGKLEFLDSAGEFYYNPANDTCYFWAVGNANPNNHEIRGSIYEDGFYSQKDSITIKNFEILQQKSKGIHFYYVDYSTIDGNYIHNQDANGIYSFGAEPLGNVIINNRIKNVNNQSIEVWSSTGVIKDNDIDSTAIFTQLGASGVGSWYGGSAIYSEGVWNLIQYNRILNTGYCGIAFYSGHNTIDKNYIKDCNLTKDDGGGIYTSAADVYPTTANNAYSVVTNNIIDGSRGSFVGFTGDAPLTYGEGIYLDQWGSNIRVENNTVTNCTSNGFYAQNGYNDTVRNNTFFRNRTGILNKFYGSNNLFTNNIIYGFSTDINDVQSERMVHQFSTSVQSTYNYNTYINHYKSSDIFRKDDTSNYSFADWKTATGGQDANSTMDVSAMGAGESEYLFYNETKVAKDIDLGSVVYMEINGAMKKGTLTLQPFTSKILISTTSIINGDVTIPVVTAFTMPTTSNTATVSVTTFTATDNTGVAGYTITESATAPDFGGEGWTASAPTTYTALTNGAKTLYAWVKDAAGNISASATRSITFSFPVTLGYPLYTNNSSTNVMRSMQVTFPEAGTISSISIYHLSGNGNVLLGVYSNNAGAPNALLATTASTAVTASDEWQTINLVTPLAVTNGQVVHLAWLFQNTVNTKYGSGLTPGRMASTNTWTGSLPATATSPTGGSTNNFSIYCTYTP